MKKLFAILTIASVMTACNSAKTETPGVDSTKITDSLKALDSAKKVVDTAKMKVDSAKAKVDSIKK